MKNPDLLKEVIPTESELKEIIVNSKIKNKQPVIDLKSLESRYG